MRNPMPSGSGAGRRALLSGLAAAGLAGVLPRQAQAAAAASDAGQWLEFRQRFIAPEGRVVDTGNRGVSHSEGQGYGLLLAEAFADRPTFERLLRWTRATLMRPEGLHAWRFRPGNGVDDPNNATDGDLYISWALLRAARRWGDTEFLGMGRALGKEIGRKLVAEAQGKRVLLPGRQGFDDAGKLVFNPSYYAFPALQALAAETRDPLWDSVIADGLKLLREARFGRWGLPADWVEVARHGSAAPTPARTRPPRFSYDAVRVPLHLAWAGLAQEPALAAATQFWRLGSLPPAWTDLRTGALGSEPASAGVVAIARLAEAARAGQAHAADLPKVNQAGDYYAAALTLLSRLAAYEAPPPGQPLQLAPPARAPQAFPAFERGKPEVADKGRMSPT